LQENYKLFVGSFVATSAMPYFTILSEALKLKGSTLFVSLHTLWGYIA